MLLQAQPLRTTFIHTNRKLFKLIHVFQYQCIFLLSQPAFYLLFPIDSSVNAGTMFKIHELQRPLVIRVAIGNCACIVFYKSTFQVIGYTGVESVIFAFQYLYVIIMAHSSIRHCR